MRIPLRRGAPDEVGLEARLELVEQDVELGVTEARADRQVGRVDELRTEGLHRVERLGEQRVDAVAEAGQLARHADARPLQTVGSEPARVVGGMCAGAPAVAASRGSAPASAASRSAASAHRARHRARRCPGCAAIGMMPARLTSPTVGLIPTSPQIDAGHTIEPSVSVPTVTAPGWRRAPTPDPELDPHGLRSSA